jgi:FMN phosphatase YigB (HAD superfamily)
MFDAVLFDLDGTLLPMDQDAFLARYFKEIALKFADRFPPDALTKALWEGSLAMIQNDGTVGNAERFWQVFSNRMGPKVLSMTKEFDAFYEKSLPRPACIPAAAPGGKIGKRRKSLRQQGFGDHPVFPQNAVHQRCMGRLSRRVLMDYFL